MTQDLTITLAQINPVVGDFPANLGKIGDVIRHAPKRADLIVFPELSLCGYSPEDLLLKPAFLNRVQEALDRLVAQSARYSPFIVVGAPHRQDGKLYNAAHVIGSGRVIATIRKRHLPNYGVFDEARVFAPGPYPAPVTVKGHSLGIMICEDMWSSDVARHLQRKGADMLIVPNASPYQSDKGVLRLEAARARAAETGLPLLYVNQVGGQDEVVYDGASFVLNETGQTVMQAESFTEDIHHTIWRRAGTRWLCSDGKSAKALPEHESMYTALMTGLRDYVTKNNFPGVLLGLSGGIDSALTATLAVDALGAEAVQGVMMPSRYTARQSLRDARALAKKLGISLIKIPVERTVRAFDRALAPHLPAPVPGIVHENLQPRARGTILMALSNASGRMVLSTGNKSEVAVGYATLYGDMCGGFNPLKDLYKTQVYALSRWRNAHKPAQGLGPKGLVIPKSVLTRPPTAELKPNQTDQDTLPPYDMLDAILAGLIEEDLSAAEIVARGHDAATVARIRQLVDRAEYKRRQAAPGVKITSKSFGRDRRYPITNCFESD